MPISKENKGGNYSKAESIQGRKLVYKRIQKGGNYSKEERNKRQETIQGNTVDMLLKLLKRFSNHYENTLEIFSNVSQTLLKGFSNSSQTLL